MIKPTAPPDGCLRVMAAIALFPWAAIAGADDSPWLYSVTGNPANVDTPTRGLIVMQGGGTDVDENYVRMAEFGGGGDFVVLRASGADEYNDYIYDLCKCDSVETIVFRDRTASDDERVLEIIRNAEALFIAGGDQSRYVRFWQGTPVQAAIHHVAARPAPIGGTSAGMAIMGEFVYSAFGPASLSSEAALGNPYHEDVTLARDFLRLPHLGHVITDQHLQERDRIGRTAVLMARLLADGWSEDVRAIAADRETALHIDPATGEARVFATAEHETPYVYMLRATTKPAVCAPDTPLTFRDIHVRRLGPGDRFDVGRWSGDDGITYRLHAENGKMTSSRHSMY
ncbi:MAG: cyanophycinase [Woeseiaceae bacterium]|nr:cyanophycinase [Woeseiaceae bacterium]